MPQSDSNDPANPARTRPEDRTSLSRSNLVILADSLKYCALNFRLLLRLGWPLLVILQVLEFLSDQYFDFTAEMIQRRGIENVALLGGTAFLEFLVGLVFTAAWFLAVIPLLTYLPTFRAIEANRDDYQIQTKPRFARNLRNHLNQLLIEETRVFAAILLRLPFFILPAPIEYIRLALVPYIVVLDDDYQNGRRDALATSRILTRGRWWLLIGAFALATLAPFALKEWIAGDGNLWLWEHPLRVVLSAGAQFVANLAGSMILFAVYKALAGGSVNNAHLQLARD